MLEITFRSRWLSDESGQTRSHSDGLGQTMGTPQMRKVSIITLIWIIKKSIFQRLLAAEEWQQNKDFITGEMHQLKRVKMYEVLREIEQEQAEKLERQKTGIMSNY